jgi:hypothetical protein
MIHPWFNISNDLLMTLYRKAVEKKLDKNFIELAFNETEEI